jgi:hypothetical protein
LAAKRQGSARLMLVVSLGDHLTVADDALAASPCVMAGTSCTAPACVSYPARNFNLRSSMTSTSDLAETVVDVAIQTMRHQYAAARSVTAGYRRAGVAEMVCQRDSRASGWAPPEALFGLLVSMTMFQRRSDLQIMRVLRGIARGDADEPTDASHRLVLSDRGCEHSRSLDALLERCDVEKYPDTKRGFCGYGPETHCGVKGLNELLKLYGHFGKCRLR